MVGDLRFGCLGSFGCGYFVRRSKCRKQLGRSANRLSVHDGLEGVDEPFKIALSRGSLDLEDITLRLDFFATGSSISSSSEWSDEVDMWSVEIFEYQNY